MVAVHQQLGAGGHESGSGIRRQCRGAEPQKLDSCKAATGLGGKERPPPATEGTSAQVGRKHCQMLWPLINPRTGRTGQGVVTVTST